MYIPSVQEFKNYLSLNSKLRRNLSSYKDRFSKSATQEELETADYYKKLYFGKNKKKY